MGICALSRTQCFVPSPPAPSRREGVRPRAYPRDGGALRSLSGRVLRYPSASIAPRAPIAPHKIRRSIRSRPIFLPRRSARPCILACQRYLRLSATDCFVRSPSYLALARIALTGHNECRATRAPQTPRKGWAAVLPRARPRQALGLLWPASALRPQAWGFLLFSVACALSRTIFTRHLRRNTIVTNVTIFNKI